MRKGVALVAVACWCAACGGSGSRESGPSYPVVESADGARLSPLNLVTIVSQTDVVDASRLFQFSTELASSAWWSRLALEYGLGAVNVAAAITGPPINADVSDHDVFTYITDAVAANSGPPRDGNSLYLLYLPANSAVVRKGLRNTDCHEFGAYHARYGTLGDNLAVVQQCSANNPIPDMTVSASHEIIEAATDPDGYGYVLPAIAPNAPWKQPIWNAYDLTGRAELADLCEGAYIREGSFYYQRIWSNQRAALGGDPCAPEIPDPFYDVLFDADWYPAPGGQTISIPIHGWSSGAMPTGWPLRVTVNSAVLGFTAVSAGSSQMLSAGETGSLSVRAPAGAPAGTFAVVTVASERPSGTDFSDGAHLNYVGVYVP